MRKKIVLALTIMAMSTAAAGCGSSNAKETVVETEAVTEEETTETEIADSVETVSEDASEEEEETIVEDADESEAEDITEAESKENSSSESDSEDFDFAGDYTSSYDGSTLNISKNDDGTYEINVSIFRLCDIENGVGTVEDGKINFTADDPNGEKLSGIITRESDGSLTVKVTDTVWDYLKEENEFGQFEK